MDRYILISGESSRKTKAVSNNIRLSELNESLLEKVKERIAWHNIALVRVKSDQSKENLFGSGTLVSLGGEYGILTAAHITKEMESMNEVGFCIGKYHHRLVIKRQHLSILYVGWCDKITDEGPDISLILVPPSEIGTIKAYKSFYPLDTKFEDNVTESDFADKDPWFISGYIGTWTISNPQNGRFAGTHGLHPFIGITENVEDYSVRRIFDYCTITVQYESNKDNPKNFEGFSGGGLWKGKFNRDPDDKLHIDDFILHGIAYFQTSIQCKSRKIICHAHRSISTAATHWQKYIEEKKAQ